MIINRLLDKLGFIIYSKSFLKQCYIKKSDFSPFSQLLYKFLHKDFLFIQIGANDGISYDPIYEFVIKNNVRGVVLEPIPFIYDKLKINYKDYPRILPLNYAIHKNKKKMDIYFADPENMSLPEWTAGIGSFNKNHYKLNGLSCYDILKTEVNCLSLDELIDKYELNAVDLLQIDTEGYDYEIIKMIDFKKIKPSIISFEHGLLDGIMEKRQLFECEEYLFNNGYNLIRLKRDCIAYLR